MIHTDINRDSATTAAPRLRLFRLGWIDGLIILVVGMGTAIAAPADRERPLTIPAQSLGDALTSLGQQTDLQILFNPDIVGGRWVTPLAGVMTPATALSALLSGTGLMFDLRDNLVTVTPMRDGGGLLLPLRVDEDAASRKGIAIPRHSWSAGRTGGPLDELPQAVSVVTRHDLDQRDVQDINGAIAYSAGVRPVDYPGGQGAIDVFLRGFRQGADSVLIDGLRSGYNPYGLEYEPFGVERVEIVKGATAAAYGAMPPGGAIVLTGKRPTDQPLHRLRLQTGSYDRRQVAADLSDRIDSDGRLRYRLTALRRRSDTQVSHTPDDRTYIAPALSWSADDDTNVTLRASFLDFRKMGAEQSFPASGTVRDNPNGTIGADVFFGYPGLSAYRAQHLSVGYDINRTLGNGWSLHHATRFDRARVHYIANWAASGVLENDRYYRYGLQDRPKTSTLLVTDTNLRGTVATGPLDHTLLVGVDHSRHHAHETRRNGTVTDPLDVFAPVYGGAYQWDTVLAGDLTDRLHQTGAYVQDQITAGRWRLTLGSRVDWSALSTVGRRYEGPWTEQRQFDQAISRQAGLSYGFGNGVTAYAGYGASFQPNTDTNVDGQAFSPTRATQWEAGFRFRPPGTEALFTLSAYRARQRNLTTADPDHPGYSTQIGAVRSQGVEAEVRAQLSDTFGLLAAYSYTDAQVTKDNPYPGGIDKTGKRVASVPRHAAALWLRQDIDTGPADGLSVGIGLRYVGATYNAGNTIRVPSYTLIDASISYDLERLTPALQRVDLTLSATNLLDHRYFSPGFYESSVFYGNRRNLLATLSYRW